MIYPFVCEDCKKEFDIECPMEDRDKIKKCIHCKSEKIRRVFTMTGTTRSKELCPSKTGYGFSSK